MMSILSSLNLDVQSSAISPDVHLAHVDLDVHSVVGKPNFRVIAVEPPPRLAHNRFWGGCGSISVVGGVDEPFFCNVFSIYMHF